MRLASRGTPAGPAPGLLAGIFMSNLAALAFEIVLTRIFSVTLWYHLAFMVVTVAMFGVGAGGLAVYFLAGRSGGLGARALLADLECIKALLMIFFLVAYLSIPFVPGQVIQPSLRSIPVVVMIFLLAALPFVAVGMLNGLAFSRYRAAIGRLYFADLAGAGVGVLLAIGGLYALSAPTLVLLLALVSCGAAAAMTPRGASARGAGRFPLRGPPGRIALCALVALGLFVMNLATERIGIRFAKNYVEDEIFYEKWSPIARITVIRYPLPAWGLGSRFSGPLPEVNYLIEQDGAAGTPVIPAAGGQDLEWLDWDVTSAGYWIFKPRSAVIIGSGGGKDVLSARRAGVTRIAAVEINPHIIDVVQDEFADLTGRPYSDPAVETHVAEGRSFLLHTQDTYDFVQLSMVDSWAATTAGAFIMSENHLYTLEAMQTYLNHLSDRGAVSLSRYFTGFFPAETLRAFALSAEALRSVGARDPGGHLLVLRSGDIGTILAARRPLSGEQEARALDEAARRGYDVLFAPSRRGGKSSFFNVLASAATPAGMYRDLPIDISPPVDDRPFFFFVLKPDFWLWGRGRGRIDQGAGLPQNVGAAILVRNIFITATVFALLIMFLPLVFQRRGNRSPGPGESRPPAPWLLYFAAIGAGFMFMEIPLIQKFILPLGHPVLATAVVLCTLLLSGGAGSHLWNRAGEKRLASRIVAVTALAAACGLAAALFLDGVIQGLVAMPAWARTAAALITVAPLGFVMGGAFPMAVRLAAESRDASVAWLWAINGAFSVQSSVLAMMLSISLGFKVCFFAAAAAYLLALAVAIHVKRRMGRGPAAAPA
jgi:hypothetical protein